MTTAYPLYDPQMEHESCGVGAVIDLRAQATHRTVSDALTIVERLAHRAGSDATGTTGDGVGILTRLPHALFARWAAEAGVSLGGEGRIRRGHALPAGRRDRRGQQRAASSIRWRRRRGLRVLLLARRALPPGTAGRSRRGAAMPRIRQCFPRPARGTPPPGRRSTAASTSSAASSKSSRPAPMSAPSPAAPSSTRA